MNRFLKIISVVTLLLFLRTSMALCADQVYFYYTDPAGTPLAMSDASGTVVWRADYMPFGEESIGTQTAQNNKMFVGKEKDSESGLYYFGARYMDAGVGRFASPDSIGAVNPATGSINGKALHNPQRLNVYAYGLNNPHRYVDPDGNTPWDVLDIAFFAHSAATFISNPSTDNGINLALDTAGLLPVVPALGTIRRVSMAASDAKNIRKVTEFIEGAEVVSHGKTIGTGTVDLRSTLQRIESNSTVYKQDGSIFRNDQGLLPQKGVGYYSEWVVPTQGVTGAGPQRIVKGQGGELFYTPDHYKSFTTLN